MAAEYHGPIWLGQGENCLTDSDELARFSA